jgi:hypothetical protein
VRDRLRQKLAEVGAKIRELNQLEHDLHTALNNCERQIRRHSVTCPLLENSAAKTARGKR